MKPGWKTSRVDPRILRVFDRVAAGELTPEEGAEELMQMHVSILGYWWARIVDWIDGK